LQPFRQAPGHAYSRSRIPRFAVETLASRGIARFEYLQLLGRQAHEVSTRHQSRTLALLPGLRHMALAEALHLFNEKLLIFLESAEAHG
jgi:hypothetical protein